MSLDGEHWALAHFPSSFQLPDGGFTILDSSTGSIFLQVLVDKSQSYGNLFRSNWNGTFYSLSLENVNEDSQGHVDFEKVIGIDGVALANQLLSTHDPIKRLVTKITFDDGIVQLIVDDESVSHFLQANRGKNLCIPKKIPTEYNIPAQIVA